MSQSTYENYFENNPKVGDFLERIRKDNDHHISPEDTQNTLIAMLRENLLDIEAISNELNADVLSEMVASPEAVLLYTAVYINMLSEKNKN